MNKVKILPIFILIVLVFSVNMHVFAAESSEMYDEYQTISDTSAEVAHVCGASGWTPVSSSVVNGVYKNKSASGCTKQFYNGYKCNSCGQITYRTEWASTSSAHISNLYHATCNGTTQTWYYWCLCCQYTLGTSPFTCPGGPHSGSCSWLPI